MQERFIYLFIFSQMLKRIAYFDWLTQIISAFCSNLNLNLQSALSLRHAKSTSSFDAFVFFFFTTFCILTFNLTHIVKLEIVTVQPNL